MASCHPHQMGLIPEQEPDLDSIPALKWIRRRMRIAPDYDGERLRPPSAE
jgi:hypothetical protein